MTTGSFSLGREAAADGRFARQESAFRDRVETLAPGRYHLYAALACPWAHRTLIVRALKGLEELLPVSLVAPYRDERGWAFPGGDHVDALNGWELLAEAYDATDPSFPGRLSVPVLWDREDGGIVNNESADIVRMMNGWSETGPDLYPADLREEIDAINDRVYSGLNDGVYQAGFAGSQAAYERAFAGVFETLNWLDELLGTRRYVAGDRITEADWRLFTTLVRFDPVYHTHFKCNGHRLIEYPNLWPYARELHQTPGVAETISLAEIKRHYYTTHDMLNPKRTIPAGPLDMDWTAPHGRG